MGLDVDVCGLCRYEKENIQHLVLDGKYVDFWRNSQNCILDKCTNAPRITISEHLVPFGSSNNIETDVVIDLI